MIAVKFTYMGDTFRGGLLVLRRFTVKGLGRDGGCRVRKDLIVTRFTRFFQIGGRLGLIN